MEDQYLISYAGNEDRSVQHSILFQTLPRWTRRAGQQTVGKRIFTDRASGALTERPELSALLEQLRPGDTLVVWRLDRLGRSISHLLHTVTALEERGVGFASLTEAIDTTTPAGRLLFGVLASLAAFERDLIRERTMAGLAAGCAGGRFGGRPPLMTPDKPVIAAQMLAEGRPKSTIAATIGVPRATLQAHLGRLASDGAKEADRG